MTKKKQNSHFDEEERIGQDRLLNEPIDQTDYLYLGIYEELIAKGHNPDWLPRILYIEQKTGKKILRYS